MWTVLWDRGNMPTTGVVLGEMTDGPDKGKRFAANTYAHKTICVCL